MKLYYANLESLKAAILAKGEALQTMNDYISRETAIIEIERYAAELTPEWAPKQNIIIEDIENIINYDVAPADVKLVKRGKWLPTKDDNKKQCSHCGVIHLIAQYPHGKAHFCPNCGADMRGGMPNG